ncbi:MAG: cation transporter [Clostridia bacterium]|nr:cation transporter [Clostridia bacterium]
MITVLSRIFLKNADSMSESKRRSAYGTLCCCVGIFLNVILFGIKCFAGIISGSVAIAADAFNNLSDAGSSAITLAGIQLANRKPDPDHPFGHGRIEYLSALAVSVVIVVVGFELLTSSVDKIRNPESVDASIVTIVILAVSVLVKGYMFFYNRRIGQKINSAGMKATAADCIGDSIATVVVLISTVISYFTDVQIDGWCGIVVSLFIMYAGFSSAKEIVNSLLGSAPEQELVEKISSLVLSYSEVVGIHDLIVHDYGPARLVVSLHAEVDGSQDIFMLHDAIDNIEQHLARELNCLAVIHMDPIETDNELVTEMKNRVVLAVTEIDKNITIHDFRMVPGNTHTNLIFDAVVPFSLKLNENEIKKEICSVVSQKCENCNCVVTIDRPFV